MFDDSNFIKWVDAPKDCCKSNISIIGMAPISSDGVILAQLNPKFKALEEEGVSFGFVIKVTLYPAVGYSTNDYEDGEHNDNPKFNSDSQEIILTADDIWYGLRIRMSAVPGRKSLPSDHRYIISKCKQHLPAFVEGDIRSFIANWINFGSVTA